MSYKQFSIISFHIILFFVGAMLYTFLGEYLQTSGFFGDTACGNCGAFDTSWSWGLRHYLYSWMSFCLFILNCVRIIILINNMFDPPKE